MTERVGKIYVWETEPQTKKLSLGGHVRESELFKFISLMSRPLTHLGFVDNMQ